jgi:class 3 adenylate cyclase
MMARIRALLNRLISLADEPADDDDTRLRKRVLVDLRGLAVHMASRIMDAADPGATLVSGTTRELTIRAGIEFVDRGARELKGISGERAVYEARLAAGTASRPRRTS